MFSHSPLSRVDIVFESSSSIKSIFLKNSSLYVPTHYDLHSQQQLLPLDQRPYRPLKIPRNPKPEKKAKTKTAKVKTRVATGTNRARVKKVAQLDEDGFPLNVEELFADLENDDFMEDDGDKDEEKEDDKGEGAFLMEKDWLLKDLKNTGTVKSLEMVKRLDPPVGEGSMECGCCFGDEHLVWLKFQLGHEDWEELYCLPFVELFDRFFCRAGIYGTMSRWTLFLCRVYDEID